MNIIITGAGFENKGAEAMLRMVQVQLTKRLPSVELFLWRALRANSQFALASGINSLNLPFESPEYKWSFLGKRIGKMLWILREVFQNNDLRKLLVLFDKKNSFALACNNYIIRTVGGFSALVDISGYAYGNVGWATDSILSIQPLINICNQLNKPVFFLPQAWGSFDNSFVKQSICKFLTTKNVYFYSRDKQSSIHLENILNKTPNSILPQPDIVFGFQGGTAEQGKDVLRRMGCSMTRPIIGVSPNVRVYERTTGKGTENKYLKTLISLICHCIKKYEVDIVLLANDIRKDGIDDRYLCSLIAAAINQNERCFMTRETLTSEEIIALISQFKLIVSSRYHSLIFAFSQGIPAIALSWSHKYRELFLLFDMAENVLEYTDINLDKLISVLEHTLKMKQKNNMLNKIKNIQLQINNIFVDLADKIIENQ